MHGLLSILNFRLTLDFLLQDIGTTLTGPNIAHPRLENARQLTDGR